MEQKALKQEAAKAAAKVRALALSGMERAVLVAAVVDAIDNGVSRSRDCWPSVDDMRVLHRLRRRLWASLGWRDGA